MGRHKVKPSPSLVLRAYEEIPAGTLVRTPEGSTGMDLIPCTASGAMKFGFFPAATRNWFSLR